MKFGKASSMKMRGFETKMRMMWNIIGLCFVSILT